MELPIFPDDWRPEGWRPSISEKAWTSSTISIGDNLAGLLSARHRPSWDETWMAVADAVALRSPCARRRIGAVIVDPTNRPISTGYNGPPAGFVREADSDCRSWCSRAQTDAQPSQTYEGCPSIHAEANALLFADRRDFKGGTLYVTSAPCWDCGKLISNSGIKRVVTRLDEKKDAHRDPHKTLQFLDDCGLEFTIWENERQKHGD